MSDALVFADPDWRRRFRRAGIETGGALRAHPALGTTVAETRTSRTDRIEVDGVLMHRKIYAYPRATDLWRAALRGTLLGSPRAVREWRALHALRADGLPAVEPAALCIERRRGWVRSTILVTRTEIDAVSLDALAVGSAAGRAALSALARVLARAHDAGHVLGRPALRDVLVHEEDGTVRLLDLPRHRGVRRVREGSAADDLSRLAAGLAERLPVRDCLRALAGYRRARRPDAPERRRFLRRVEGASRAHREREEARLAPRATGRK